MCSLCITPSNLAPSRQLDVVPDKKQGARGQITGRPAGHLEQLDQTKHWAADGIYLL